MRALFVAAALLFVAGMATCYFGVQHEIAQIPPEQRARMTDTDWEGVEWVRRASWIHGAAALVFVTALVLRARARR